MATKADWQETVNPLAGLDDWLARRSNGSPSQMMSSSDWDGVEAWLLGSLEGHAEGRLEEAVAFTFRLLRRKFGKLGAKPQAGIQSLPLALFEELGEALLDFRTPEDLRVWLRQHDRKITVASTPKKRAR